MEKNRKRALRRHHAARIKAKRIDYYGGYIRRLPKPARLRHLGLVSRTAKLYSCWMCGNPRRWWKEQTVQEKRFMQELTTYRNDL